MKKSVVCLALVMLASGCEVSKTPLPTGGSKADALVEMSYQTGSLEVAKVDWATADRSALKRCNAWGYRKADPFEGVKTHCTNFDMYGCNQSTVTKVYQCTN